MHGLDSPGRRSLQQSDRPPFRKQQVERGVKKKEGDRKVRAKKGGDTQRCNVGMCQEVWICCLTLS